MSIVFFTLVTFSTVLIEITSYQYADQLSRYKEGDKLSTSMLIFLTAQIGYLLLLLIGLVTSQWKWFLILVLMGFVPKSKLGATYTRIDAVLTIIITLLMFLDRFHNITNIL